MDSPAISVSESVRWMCAFSGEDLKAAEMALLLASLPQLTSLDLSCTRRLLLRRFHGCGRSDVPTEAAFWDLPRVCGECRYLFSQSGGGDALLCAAADVARPRMYTQ